MTLPSVRVVVLNYNGGDHVMRCLDHLSALDWPTEQLEIVVVDNASTDGTAQAIAEAHPDVDLVRLSENLGFPANNVALRSLDEFDFAALVNNDAFVRPDWLTRLVAGIGDDPKVGAACSKILFSSDLPDSADRGGADRQAIINNAGSVVFVDGYGADRGFGEVDDGQYDQPSDVFAFCGNGVLLRREFVADVGYFDPELFLYYEDTDLSWRGRARGWSYRYVPGAVVDHLHAATSGGEESATFRYFNERNRLVCLVKNAPRSMAVRQALRFLASTVSYLLHGDLGATGTRLRAFSGFLALLPHAMRERRVLRAQALVADAELVARLTPR